jgi:hypothetical protein
MDETIVPTCGGNAHQTAPPRIEGFAFVRPVGHGAMGVVWEAVQSATHRRVAVKLLAGHRMDPEGSARFRREIELAARLEHPGIARVYDGGVCQGQPYYCMEFIEGLPLDRFADQTGLDRKQRIELMAQVGDAVQFAHQRGIIHRDLKPSNILVSADGEPHVLDFGLAKLLDSPPEDAMSMDGDIMGTPIFMSPEQARGATRDLDVRTDVYSLGVMLYSLVVGLYPHDVSGSNYDILKRVVENEPRAPRSLVRNVDAELQTVLLKAVARERTDRYASAGELAEDLRRYLRGDPLLARPPTLGYLLRRGVYRHRAAAAVVAAVVAALSAMALDSYARIRRARDRETAARVEAETHLAAANRNYAAALVEKARQRFQEGRPNEGKTFLAKALEVNPGLDRRAIGILDAMHPGFPRILPDFLRDPALRPMQGPMCSSADERYLFYTRGGQILRRHVADGSHDAIPFHKAGLESMSAWGSVRWAYFKASSNGRYLAIASQNAPGFRVLDFDQPQRDSTTIGPRVDPWRPGIFNLDFSPDETECAVLVATEESGPTLVIHRLPDLSEIARVPIPAEAGAAGLAYSGDGRHLLLGTRDHVEAWDRQSLARRRRFSPGDKTGPLQGHAGIRFIAHDAASDRVAFHGQDGFVHVFELSSGAPVSKTAVESPPNGLDVRFSHQGRVLAFGSDLGTGGLIECDTGRMIEHFPFALGVNVALFPKNGWFMAENYAIDIQALNERFPQEESVPASSPQRPGGMPWLPAAELPAAVRDGFDRESRYKPNDPELAPELRARQAAYLQAAFGNDPTLSAFQNQLGEVVVHRSESNETKMFSSRFWMRGIWLEAFPDRQSVMRIAQEGSVASLEWIDFRENTLTRFPLDGAYEAHALSDDLRNLAIAAGGKVKLFDRVRMDFAGDLFAENVTGLALSFEPGTHRLLVRHANRRLTRHDLGKSDGRHLPDYAECVRRLGYRIAGMDAVWNGFATDPPESFGYHVAPDGFVVFEFDVDTYVRLCDVPPDAETIRRIKEGPLYIAGEFNQWNMGDTHRFASEWVCDPVAPGVYRLTRPLTLFAQQRRWPFKFFLPGMPLEPPEGAINRERAFADDPWSGLHNLVLEIESP